LTAIAGISVVVREGASWTRLFVGFFQPLVACGVMAVAVFGVEYALAQGGIDHPAIRLVVGIIVGAVTYVSVALVVCRSTAKDLLQLLKKALKRD
ncbi:MAG: hypothetical protein AB7O24_18620, partial [Kofleriaceae bacterium]